MECVVRAYPILEGQRAELEQFAREIRERADETRAFYDRFNVHRETWHVQETEHGTWVIGVTEVDTDGVESVASAYSTSEREFDAWFKRRIRDLTGIDPNLTPLGPPTTCIFDTRELAGAGGGSGS